MEPKELEAKLKEFSAQVEILKKDFQIKIDAAEKDARQWRDVAQKKEEEAKKFQEQTEKDAEARKKADAEVRKTEHKAFVDKAKADGKIVPAQDESVLKLMESLSAEGEVAKFQAKDGSWRSHSQLSLFKEVIQNSGKRVDYGYRTTAIGRFEPATPDKGGGGQQIEVFHQGAKVMLPLDGADLAAKAFEYQAEFRKRTGKEIDYDDALIAVEKEERLAK